jgi:hypothetical protein
MVFADLDQLNQGICRTVRSSIALGRVKASPRKDRIAVGLVAGRFTCWAIDCEGRDDYTNRTNLPAVPILREIGETDALERAPYRDLFRLQGAS